MSGIESTDVDTTSQSSVQSNSIESSGEKKFAKKTFSRKNIDKTLRWLVRAYEYTKRPRKIVYDSSSDEEKEEIKPATTIATTHQIDSTVVVKHKVPRTNIF